MEKESQWETVEQLYQSWISTLMKTQTALKASLSGQLVLTLLLRELLPDESGHNRADWSAFTLFMASLPMDIHDQYKRNHSVRNACCIIKNQANISPPVLVSLGHMEDGTALGDVELPPWAKGDPQEFIRIHREVSKLRPHQACPFFLFICFLLSFELTSRFLRAADVCRQRRRCLSKTRAPLSWRSCVELLCLSTHSGGDDSYSMLSLSDWSKRLKACLSR